MGGLCCEGVREGCAVRVCRGLCCEGVWRGCAVRVCYKFHCCFCDVVAK